MCPLRVAGIGLVIAVNAQEVIPHGRREEDVATVRIIFSGGDVPVITGAQPPSKDVPIAGPRPKVGTANFSFPAQAGEHCYGLETTIPHTPLWHVGMAIDGVPLHLRFDVKNMLEMG